MASKYRKKVMRFLQKPMTPMDIADKTGIRINHVSNTLSELLEKKLVVCLTPKLKKGRLYDLTKEGKKILQNL